MTREQEVAWAAGLFEGEGCFTTSRTGKGKRRVQLYAILSSTDSDVIESFHRIVGVGTVHDVVRPPSKPARVWQCSRIDDVRAVVHLLLPYLHARRCARALEILEMWEANRRELTLEPRSCAWCGGSFTPPNDRALYCCQTCGAKAHSRRQVLRKKLKLVVPKRQSELF